VCVGNFEDAEKYLEEANKLASSSGEIYSKIIIYRSFAKIYDHKGNFKRSIEYINQSINLSHELGFTHFEASSYIERGNYYQKQGENFELAIESNLKAIQLAQKLNLVKIEAVATGNMGVCYIEIGEIEKAQKALKYAIDNLDGLLAITYKINYGVLSNNQEDFISAKYILNNVIEIIEKEGDNSYNNELRRAYLNLSNSLLRSDELENAKNAAEKSKIIAIKLNNKDGEMRACVNLGIALSETNNLYKGISELRNAYDIACEYYGKNSSFSKHMYNLIDNYMI
jgi:tetratricopeptide (TPR) repeat protein